MMNAIIKIKPKLTGHLLTHNQFIDAVTKEKINHKKTKRILNKLFFEGIFKRIGFIPY